MNNADKIREFLIEEIEKDAIGPLMGEDEEWLEWEKPQTRYFSGVLYPKKTPFKSDDHLKNTNGESGKDDDEDDEASSFSIAVGTKPSSLGLTCQISEEVEKIKVDIDFGKYDPIKRPKKSEKKKDDTKTESEIDENPAWKRRQVHADFTLEIKDAPGGYHEIKDEYAQVQFKISKIKNKRRTISIFLMNIRPPIPDDEYIQDNMCIFQPLLKLKSPTDEKNIFLSIEETENKFYEEKGDEAKRNELLFRNKKYFATGHNCSTKWSKKIISNCVKEVETTLLPRYVIENISPRKMKDDFLKLKTLKDVENFSEYKKLLEPIKNKYKNWVEEKRNEKSLIPERFIKDDTVQRHLDNCDDVIQRIDDGIKEISKENSDVGEAFRFANKVMYNQMRYSRWAKENQKNGGKNPKSEKPTDENIGERDNNPAWRVFQLAFFLLNIESITNRESKNRETVDLLWFPTGGGKTEAYLGIIAFNIALRRLRETGWNRYGTAVIMRYTYRLLTLQQFQRAAALMCACEYERHKNKTKWGDEPFLVGLFVGDNTTPNDLKVAEEKLREYKFTGVRPEEKNPVQITSCPWCGTSIGPNEYPLVKKITKKGETNWVVPDLPRRMRVRCKNPKCHFGTGNKDSDLPVVFIDDDINSSLPTLLIGTVDKFARLSWKSIYCSIFGKVQQYCKQHGYIQSTQKTCRDHKNPEWKKTNNPIGPLPPPELIIQDELHLITGPLGTLVGLYETAIDALCEHNGIKPKIIASTATVKNSDNQIKWLFGRDKSKIFPPQLFEFGDTFFSEIIPTNEKKGKIHLGVCATSVGGYTVDARIAALLLRKIRYLFENKDKFGFSTADLDPYFTLVSYYNTIKNIGAAVNMYDDSVPNFMGTIRKVYEKGAKHKETNLNKEELTGRIDAGKIPLILNKLENPLDDNLCKCEEKHEETEKNVCSECGKSTKIPLDSLLCTNMLSVGVDVSRLSLMLINGMPKHYSEYIQASGRIGRTDKSPGLVVTNYTYLRARDLSIFEDFENFHSKYHMMVEPGTLTPFASRARDAGLFGVLVALVRNMADLDNGCKRTAEVPYWFDQQDNDLTRLLEKIKEKIRDKVTIVDSKELEDTEKDLEKLIEKWYSLAEFKENPELKYKRNYYEYGKNSEHNIFLLKRIGDIDPPGKEGQFVPDSLRQAEGNILVYYQPTAEDTESEKNE